MWFTASPNRVHCHDPRTYRAAIVRAFAEAPTARRRRRILTDMAASTMWLQHGATAEATPYPRRVQASSEWLTFTTALQLPAHEWSCIGRKSIIPALWLAALQFV